MAAVARTDRTAHILLVNYSYSVQRRACVFSKFRYIIHQFTMLGSAFLPVPILAVLTQQPLDLANWMGALEPIVGNNTLLDLSVGFFFRY